YAREAGQQGQLLEERDLTDSAIAERLRSDLHLRALATRLLQKYGYLLPKLNPDSDAAEERALMLRQQAQLQRVSGMQQAPPLAAPTPQLPNCDPRKSLQCAAQWQAAFPQEGATGSGPASEAPLPEGNQNVPRLSLPSSDPLLKAETTQTSGPETLLASAKDGEAGNPSSFLNPGQGAMKSPASSLAQTGGELPASPSDAMAAVLMASAGVNPESGILPDSLHGPAGLDDLIRDYRMPSGGNESVEPVKMIRRPNPYADVPALYDLYVQAAPNLAPMKRFGLNVFQRGAAKSDLLPMDLPVGPDYVIGPGDSLAIDLWGGVSQRLFRTVDREGRVALPEAGPLLVAGKTLGEVQTETQRVLRTQFRDISTDVSLLRLRTVRVYVVGEVSAPGAYDISSMSTALNALFSAGGVTSRGSLRRIQHYRGTDLLEEVDAYDLLLHGVRGKLQRLEAGDSLRVPPLGPVVTVDGMVRRPATYELREEKNLEDVLDLAGGILPAAALRHVEVQRLVAHEKRTMFSLDLGEASDSEAMRRKMREFAVQDGDEIHIFPIAAFNTQAVYLEGHVIRPGRYSYHDGMKLTDLIAGYRDLLPEPAGKYAEIIRLTGANFKPVVEGFDLDAALADPAHAPKLEALDTVRIFGRYDFEAKPEIQVMGDVRKPGTYRTSGQEHLRDAVYQAGGATQDAWMDTAQVFRTQRDGTTKVFSVNLANALEGNPLDNLLIEPRDRVLVHELPELAQPATVYIQGNVAHPGRYPFAVNMTAGDLVKSAGGVLRSGNAERATVVQFEPGAQTKTKSVTANLAEALDGNEGADVALKPGDVVTIPERAGWRDIGASVTVRGEVQNAGTYGIHPGERLSEVLASAGGLTEGAFPYGAVLTRESVREAEMKAHVELVTRVKMEQVAIKALPENDQDQKNLKMTAMAVTQTTLDQLESIAPIGRVVIHIGSNVKEWKNTTADPFVEDGDVLVIPKRANDVTITGQVFHPTAINYRPGRNAKWYLSQAGGITQMANKQAAFVVRADGSVIASKNNSNWLSGNPLDAVLKPGDAVVVPEKAPNIGVKNWTTTLQLAQIASSIAFTAAYVVH
ncbi:MAG TPA: SLBB domain-containing protein, partial [Candidatus Acidoferrales bacterium]|nr:SLBB domain-containing protein [Candidatus Acidoferrales bacterium]